MTGRLFPDSSLRSLKELRDSLAKNLALRERAISYMALHAFLDRCWYTFTTVFCLLRPKEKRGGVVPNALLYFDCVKC